MSLTHGLESAGFFLPVLRSQHVSHLNVLTDVSDLVVTRWFDGCIIFWNARLFLQQQQPLRLRYSGTVLWHCSLLVTPDRQHSTKYNHRNGYQSASQAKFSVFLYAVPCHWQWLLLRSAASRTHVVPHKHTTFSSELRCCWSTAMRLSTTLRDIS